MRTYIVLERLDPRDDPGEVSWVNVGSFEEDSSDAACRAGATAAFRKDGSEGRRTFVAITERSFKPVEVTIEPAPVVTIAARVGTA